MKKSELRAECTELADMGQMWRELAMKGVDRTGWMENDAAELRAECTRLADIIAEYERVVVKSRRGRGW